MDGGDETENSQLGGGCLPRAAAEGDGDNVDGTSLINIIFGKGVPSCSLWITPTKQPSAENTRDLGGYIKKVLHLCLGPLVAPASV